MSQFRFRGFPVYRDLRMFRKELKELSKKNFPSDTDFSRFLNNSLTSINEVVACLDLAYDDGYLNEQIHGQYFDRCASIPRQLLKFSSKVRNSRPKQ